MSWIKLNHTTGVEYVNLNQVYKINRTSPVELTFYDANSILPISFTFNSAQDLNEVLLKLEAIVSIIDLDKLAPQR
jgi:hypothetical protein